MTSGFKVFGTNHTSFTVTSLDRVIAFFREVLGFELTSRAGRDPDVVQRLTGVDGADVEIAFLAGAGHVVELIEYRASAGMGVRSRPCDAGAAHLAFNVSNVVAAVAAARAHGFVPLGEIIENRTGGPNQGSVVVYLQDEDGVTIEFVQPAERQISS